LTYYDVYIGRLDDPGFSWGSQGREGSPPRRLGPFFPPARRGSSRYPGGTFGELLNRIDEGRLEGGQVDWGSWVAKASRAEILAFMDELYANDPTYSPPTAFPHLLESLEELRGFVKGLDPNETYALVASEL
jgi:hypothetical protein